MSKLKSMPVNVLIVFCHPEPHSFNSYLRDAAIETFEAQGGSVEVSDLYAEKFDPVEKPEHYSVRANAECFEPLTEQRHASKTDALPDDITREIARLKKCDLLILQFPLWWHQQPAMLKGWFDRVFVAGGLYNSKMRYDKGYFKGKRAICSVTSGAPKETFTQNGRGGGEIESLLHPMNFSLHYMGFSVLPPYLFDGVQSADFSYKSPEEFDDHLQTHLHNWQRHLRQIDHIVPLDYPGWDDWNKGGAKLQG